MFVIMFFALLLSNHSTPANSLPTCWEDEAMVVAPDTNPAHGLTWVCVPIDNFLDDAGLDVLDDAILAEVG